MSAVELATPRLKQVQHAALAMLVVAGVVNYIDRATLAVANPLIREELGLSIADMGYLLSAFLWAYAFAQLPTGAMVDRLGRPGLAKWLTAARGCFLAGMHGRGALQPNDRIAFAIVSLALLSARVPSWRTLA